MSENLLNEATCSLFNPFMPSGLFYLYSLDRSIFYIRGVWLVLLLLCL